MHRTEYLQLLWDQLLVLNLMKSKNSKKNMSQILDALKKQKSQFRTFCREEKVRLIRQIEELADQTDTDEDENELEVELHADREKHAKLKLQLAVRNKEIANIQRKLDD